MDPVTGCSFVCKTESSAELEHTDSNNSRDILTTETALLTLSPRDEDSGESPLTLLIEAGEYQDSEDFASAWNAICASVPDVSDRLQLLLDGYRELLRSSDADDREANLSFYLAETAARFPALKRYFYDLPAFKVFTNDGMAALAKHLQRKGSLKLPLHICAGEGEFREEVRSFRTCPEDGGRKLLAVREGGGHVSLVYLERTSEGKIAALMCDSLGFPTHYLESLYRVLAGEIPNSPVYMTFQRRQYDASSCPVFLLRDAVFISRNPGLLENIPKNSGSLKLQLPADEDLAGPAILWDRLYPGCWDNAPREGSLDDKRENFRRTLMPASFVGLSPEMLKSTQNWTEASKFVAPNCVLKSGETYAQFLTRHREDSMYSSEDNPLSNGMIGKRFYKYAGVLMEQALFGESSEN